MAPSKQADALFISYRRHDQALFAELLTERLRSKGRRVFLDVDSIALGHDWRRSIQEALAVAHRVVVLVGGNWRPERLSDPADVVAYELRAARRFARTVVPVLIGDAQLPASGSMPPDLAWFTELNAFKVLNPPDHQPYLHSLVDQLGMPAHLPAANPGASSSLNGTERFSIPINAGQLSRLAGNIGFRTIDVPPDTRWISLSRTGNQLWTATCTEVQVGVVPGFKSPATRKFISTECLQALNNNRAVLLRSGLGYHAPDNLWAYMLELRKSQLQEISNVHLGGIFGDTPLLSVSPENSHATVLFRDQSESWGTDKPPISLLATLDLNTGHEAERLSAERAKLQCFGPTAEALYTLSEFPVELRQISRESGEVTWSLELPLRSAAGLIYRPACRSVLATDGATLIEASPSTGTVRHILQGESLKVERLAVDPSSTLLCVVEDERCLLLAAAADQATEIRREGSTFRAASCASGVIALLVGNSDKRDHHDMTVLLATGVAVADSGELVQS